MLQSWTDDLGPMQIKRWMTPSTISELGCHRRGCKYLWRPPKSLYGCKKAWCIKFCWFPKIFQDKIRAGHDYYWEWEKITPAIKSWRARYYAKHGFKRRR